MFLALAEMRRAKVRFGLLIGAIALLVFLILFQQSLQNGLLTSFVGGIRNQDAPVLVYSVDGQRTVQGSVITPDLEALVRGTDGVGEVGRWSQGTFTVVTGGGTRMTGGGGPGEDAVDASIIGFDTEGLGTPSDVVDGRLPTAAGEAIASDADAATGFAVGDVIRVLPGGFEIEIVGLARDVQLNASPTMYVQYDTYLDVIAAVNPDAGTPLPSVLTVRPADGVSDAEVSTAINDRSLELDALPRETAADETPGVAQVRQSFQIIFLLYALVIPCVTGLFFLIITFQKAGALTLLRAIGAPAHRLVSALMIQAALIVTAGFALGTLLYLPVSQQRLGGIPLRFETAAVVLWAGVLTVLALGSALISARRVLAIDPVEATTGTGVGR